MLQGVQPEGHLLTHPLQAWLGHSAVDVGPVNQCIGDVIWL